MTYGNSRRRYRSGKTLFHLVALDASGRVVIRKRCSRTPLLAFTANVRTQRIGMEAAVVAHIS
jgi:hypothetical protein